MFAMQGNRRAYIALAGLVSLCICLCAFLAGYASWVLSKGRGDENPRTVCCPETGVTSHKIVPTSQGAVIAAIKSKFSDNTSESEMRLLTTLEKDTKKKLGKKRPTTYTAGADDNIAVYEKDESDDGDDADMLVFSNVVN
jgi:hypothetical protein